jgi:hypothetical protein
MCVEKNSTSSKAENAHQDTSIQSGRMKLSFIIGLAEL